MTKPKVGDLVKCALDAAIAAALRYQAMSGGKTVHDHAIETFVSSKIAEALFEQTRKDGGTVGLEVPFADVFSDSRAERRGGTGSALSPRSRFDVVCYSDGMPVGLIEVKKRFNASTGGKDVIRLSDAVQRYGTLHSGSVNFGLWIALQRIAEGNARLGSDQAEAFTARFRFAIPPKIQHVSSIGEYGTFKRSGRNVSELRAFGVLFES